MGPCFCSNLDLITAGTQEFAVHGCAVMLRTTKWKHEKTKVKVVFRLQFHATNIPQSGWDKLFICFIPAGSGKIIAKTSKANVRNGTCKWADPIYETTSFLIDSRNKRYDEKLYNLIVGMGTSHASILGEAIINLADYADALNPFVIALPLHESEHGTILHVTVQLLTAKTGFREFEQQFDKGLQSSNNFSREVEPTFATSSSELQISDGHENKVNTRTHFRSESKELISIMEETSMHQDFSDSPIVYNGPCNNSESYNADKHDSSCIRESQDLNGSIHSQISSTENTDYSKDNNLAFALEENHRLKGSLEMAESFIFELRKELSTLHNQANEMNMETQNIAQHLTHEISSGLKLEREVRILRSECSKFKDELKHLSEIKLRSQLIDKPQGQRVNGLFLVEGRIRELQKKILIRFRESDLCFINSDLEMLLSIVQNLEKETGNTNGFDLGESQSLELLLELNEARVEKGNLIKKMNEMECYYESLVQELEENRDRILVEFQKLRYEHSTCINTISSCKSETESIRLCMKDQILKFEKERLAFSCVNEELEKRVMVADAFVQELEENRERILKEFENLKSEHSACGNTISSCKYETESIHRDLKHQTLKFTKEKQELEYVKQELEKRVTTSESRVQELEKNREQILGEFRSLKNEHSTCVDTISSLKAEIESIHCDMKDQALKFDNEKHDLGCVEEQLEKRVRAAGALVQELEKNREEILGELQSLKNEHSTCGDTILTYKNMNDQILRLEKERHDLGCVNRELKKTVMTTEALVQELEEKHKQLLGEFQSLKNEHSACSNTIITCKSKTESICHEMEDQILKSIKEIHDLSCANKDLERRVSELEENREQILRDFQSLINEHSRCGYTISVCKKETESIHLDMNNQILRLEKEKHDLGCVNEELKKTVMTTEALVQDLEEKLEQILGEFQSLKDEHSTCSNTILMYKSETESVRHEMEDQILKSVKERHDLSYVNKELEKRVSELEENWEQILGDFQSLKNEHSRCGDTISACKMETESICLDMNNQILRLEKEKHDLGCVNEELKQMIMTTKALVHELEEKQEQILGEFQSLKDEHSTCSNTILTYKTETESIRHEMKDQILKFAKERHDWSCFNKELKGNREQILGDLQILRNEHSTCGDTFSTCKTETESLHVDMNNQILKITEEKHALSCVNKELEKRITTLEAALEKGRLKYSVVVTQLQKDLDLLSAQVSTMFETNQKLIKKTFSSKHCPNIEQNFREKQIMVADGLSDELYKICSERLYLDVYSLTLEEKVLEVSRYANKMKEYAKKSKNVHEKNPPEQQSESLRIAFMKEQCETTVQELKQQLFVSKRHGDDILIKLQDALDETEIRKKSEASYLKKIEEMSFRIGGLEGELQLIQAELDCALLNLECCKEEKEKIVAQTIELEKMKNRRSILTVMSCGSTFQDLQRELMQVHKANEKLEAMYPSFKDFTGDGNTLGRVLALEIELAGALMAKNKSNIQFQSSFLKQHSDEEAIFRSFRDINELIKDTLEIKGKYVDVETELNDMHARYSQLSLQLAEVEGERQKLMMTVKNLR